MSMFQICGQVVNLFDAPGRIDKETGEAEEDKRKVQILGELPQRNGQQKIEVVTLSCHNPEDFEQFQGKRVRVPLGIFSPSKGNIVYFIPQGCKPILDTAGGGV